MRKHSRRSFLTGLLAALPAALLAWLGGKNKAPAASPASARRRLAAPWPGRVIYTYDRHGRLRRVQYLDPLQERPSQVVYHPGAPVLSYDASLGQFSYSYDATPSRVELPPGPANA
jgi:hypothetical protein